MSNKLINYFQGFHFNYIYIYRNNLNYYIIKTLYMITHYSTAWL